MFVSEALSKEHAGEYNTTGGNKRWCRDAMLQVLALNALSSAFTDADSTHYPNVCQPRHSIKHLA